MQPARREAAMEARPRNHPPQVRPVYDSPEDEVRRPDTAIPVSDYFLRYWVPRLPPALTVLILVLRHAASTAGTGRGGWEDVSLTARELARRVGVRDPGTIRRLLRHPHAPLFIRVTPRRRYHPRLRRPVQGSHLYSVAMYDPLLPEHEGKAVVAEAEQIISGHPLPTAAQIPHLTGRQPAGGAGRSDMENTPPSGRSAAADKPAEKPAPIREGTEQIPVAVGDVIKHSLAEKALVDHGVLPDVARALVESYGAERVLRQVSLLAGREVRNPAGWLVVAVRSDFASSVSGATVVEERPGPAPVRPPGSGPGDRGGEEDTVEDRERLRRLFEALPGAEREGLLSEAERRVRELWPFPDRSPPRMFVDLAVLGLVRERYGGGAVSPGGEVASGLAEDDRPGDLPSRFVTWMREVRGIDPMAGGRRKDVVRVRRAAWLALVSMGVSMREIARTWGVYHSSVQEGVARGKADPETVRMAEELEAVFRRHMAVFSR